MSGCILLTLNKHYPTTFLDAVDDFRGLVQDRLKTIQPALAPVW